MSSPRILVLTVLALALAVGLYVGLRALGRGVTGPRPDLKFAAFPTARPAPQPGQKSDIEIFVTNLGPGPVNEAVEVVVFRDDPRTNSGQEPVAAGRLEKPLTAGEHAPVTLPFTAPDETGALQLYFTIDPDRRLSEVSHENNVLLAEIRVVPPPEPMPDLAVTEIRFEPPAPRANQDILIVTRVANEGDAPTRTPVALDLYINDPIGPQPRLPGTRRLTAPPLRPGQDQELSARVRFDAALLVGVFAQIDTDEEVRERNEINNVMGPQIVAVGTAEQHGDPDLVVESIELLDSPDDVYGSTGRVRVRVANVGRADTSSSFSVNVDFSPSGGWGPGYPPDDPEEPDWSRDLRFLAAGQTFSLPVIPVPFVQSGAWRIVAVIDPYDEVEEGGHEGNNERGMTLNIPGRR
jgi:hypothetical protein